MADEDRDNDQQPVNGAAKSNSDTGGAHGDLSADGIGPAVVEPNSATVADSLGLGPDSFAGGTSSSAGKRSAKPAGKRKGARNTAPQNPENLTVMLYSLHYMLATAVFQTPEIALSEKEAQEMADAIQRVNALYDTAILSPAMSAWINLAVVTGGTYGKRAIAIWARKAEEKEIAEKTQVVQ